MITMDFTAQPRAIRSLSAWQRQCAFGFLYWLTFLLILEPGNVLRAAKAGHPLTLEHEVLRILVAAALATSVTPLLLTMTRRFPVAGVNRWRHLLVHVSGVATLAFGLIVFSCFLATWYVGEHLPSLIAVQDQLISNWLLLIYGLAGFIVITHATYFRQWSRGLAPKSKPAKYLTRVPVKHRGRSCFVDLSTVDWIETQGNYLALHAGSTIHLIRETAAKLEANLDPNRFVRIHRRVIVAIDRLRELQPLSNGDATLLLANGSELRASRRYRETLRQRWTELSSTS